MSILNEILHTTAKIISKKEKGSARPVPIYACSRVPQENLNTLLQKNAEYP